MKNSVLALVVLLFFSCSQKDTDYFKLKTFIETHNLKIENYNNILIVSETGCINCSKSFALLIQRQLKKEKSLFVISASGKAVDISEFLESKNTILDYQDDFSRLNITQHSSAIFLKDNAIDIIINIKAKGIKEDFSFINSRL